MKGEEWRGAAIRKMPSEGLEELLERQLERAEAACARLVELAREKRRILLAGPKCEELAKGLERIVAEEEALLARLRELESEEQVPPVVASGVPPRGNERIQRFFQMVEELRQLNCENAEILKRFQSYVSFMATLLEKRTGSKTYADSDVTQGKGRKPTLGLSRISRQV
ncbi:MAG: hypothetical protein ACPLTR_03625 [Thermacetogeniaceae bacterium]